MSAGPKTSRVSSTRDEQRAEPRAVRPAPRDATGERGIVHLFALRDEDVALLAETLSRAPREARTPDRRTGDEPANALETESEVARAEPARWTPEGMFSPTVSKLVDALLGAWARVSARTVLAMDAVSVDAVTMSLLSMLVAILLSSIATGADLTSQSSSAACAGLAPATEDELAVWALLQPNTEAGEPDAAAISARIARPGAAAAGPIVAILFGESEEPEVAYAIHPRAIEMRRKILVDALKLLPAHDAIDGLRSRITSKTNVDARLLAIQVLADIGGPQAFDGALGIAAAFDPIQWQRTYVQTSIEKACFDLVGRNPRLARRLASDMHDAPSGLAQIEARALTKARAATALPALLGSLGRDAQLDLCALEQLATIGDHCDPLADPDALKRLRATLESTDHDVQRAALVAVARIGDTESVPVLISRLGSADALTHGSARWALETISGEKLGADPAAWNEWWSKEKAWVEDELPKLADALLIRDAELLKANVDAGLSHRAHRHEVASAVKPMLEAQDPSVQRFACEVLGRVGSPRAVPWLVDKLESENEDVRNAAWSSLKQITKYDVPLDGAAWKIALAP